MMTLLYHDFVTFMPCTGTSACARVLTRGMHPSPRIHFNTMPSYAFCLCGTPANLNGALVSVILPSTQECELNTFIATQII